MPDRVWAEAAISWAEALVCWVEAETCSALALDSSPANEFEQKLKAYDPESIAAARQYARAADMKGMMARVAPS